MIAKLCSIEDDYSYYDRKNLPKAEEVEFSLDSTMQMLLLGLGNGLFVELKIETFCEEDYSLVKKMYCNVGNASVIEPDQHVSDKLWLYEDGCEIFKQGSENYLMLKSSK